MSKSVLPMFFSKNFIVPGLTFSSLIHSSLFLCIVLEACGGRGGLVGKLCLLL